MITTTIDADRISQLPDHIIHHILSFLPTPEMVRLSVLSKPWYRVFTSFPVSDFSGSPCAMDSDRRLEFAAFVYTSLLRQCRHHRSIPKFRLSFTKDRNLRHLFSTPPKLQRQLDELFNLSIRLAIQKGVKELSIQFYSYESHRLPETVFAAKELVVCRLNGCAVSGTINWPSLRELSLKRVEIYDQRIIDNLIFTCPFIEKFALIKSRGLNYLRLLGFRKLKKVKVTSQGFPSEEKEIKIEIAALSLQSFSYSPYSWIFDETRIDLTSCKTLEVFKIRRTIADNMIQYIHSKFPTLKFLVLDGFIRQRIEILMPQLEKLYLALHHVEEEEEVVIINTPRLQSFKYAFRKIPSLFSLNKTSLQEVTLKLFLDDIYSHHGENFLEDFREYLKNFDQIKLVTLEIFGYSPYGIHEIISNNPVLFDISRLKLKTSMHGKTKQKECQAFVDDLFCICRPKSLLLGTGWGTNDIIIEILCKKLVRRAKSKQYCAATQGKRWRHDLKGVKVEHCGRNGYTKVLTCDDLLDSLQTFEKKDKIRFVFEW